MSLRLLIVNGYPEKNREVLTQAGVCGADELYYRSFGALMPGMRLETLYIADLDVPLPGAREIEAYDGVVWTGSNLTIYEDDPRVTRQIEFCQRVYDIGRPQFGSCWGVQMAAIAAGGEVRKNPKGREMGFARRIVLTPEGHKHPMYDGKPLVFDGFISHLDEVTRVPAGAMLLATNDHTHVQALDVHYKNGTFWATQYHPEYELYEMARLIIARGENLIKEGFFADRTALEGKVERMTALARDPSRKDLRWDMVLGDDILDDGVRRLELRNWLDKLVIPSAKRLEHA